ncbi:B-lymphocyte antigen CD19 isoform X2 [Dendropsophus ebraccatus]|uniref:B-lymphocyte antigen CD19 isoform X2 n=1 Tax=Dendropsophus ebraccatus TaxID=150705 RepID=UPI003831AC89
MLLLLLILSLCSTCSAHNPGHTGIPTVLAEGSSSIPCGFYTASPIPLMVKLQMEESNNNSWMVVGMAPTILMLNTKFPIILLTSNDNKNISCSVDNMTSQADRLGEGFWINYTMSEDQEWFFCNVSTNWSLLQWSRGGEVIAMVERAEIELNVLVVRSNDSFIIHSLNEKVAEKCSCLNESVIKTLNVTCQWLPPQNTSTGWKPFIERKYWIIVVVVSSSTLLYVMLLGCIVSMKLRRRARRRAKSRFFKVSTAARNLYTNTQETDVVHKDQEFTYQNVSLSPTKVVNEDCFSDKSSFLSVGGDSYLEPMADGVDQVSDGDCYESPTEDQDDHEGSLDGDCYENADEEIKDGSVGAASETCITYVRGWTVLIYNNVSVLICSSRVLGSQSYEDMKGSISVTEASPDEGITQDEDADSYENMQTPLDSQSDHPCNPQPIPTEDQTEGRGASLVEAAAHHYPWKVASELQEQNGDFYLSYETNKL